jgi:hypothetical protein
VTDLQRKQMTLLRLRDEYRARFKTDPDLGTNEAIEAICRSLDEDWPLATRSRASRADG